MSLEQHPRVTYRFTAIVLAAGIGKRMQSQKPKVLHKILGRPIIDFVVANARSIGADEIIVVIGRDSALLKKSLGDTVQYALQPVPRGTGDAARCGIDKAKHDRVLILYGDVPLLTKNTLLQIMHQHEKTNSDLTVLTCHMNDPYGYGRILRDEHARISGIVEQSDATETQSSIQEINAGVYFGKTGEIQYALTEISGKNNQGELYLTDVIGVLLRAGKTVTAHMICEADEIMGINSKLHLSRARDIVKTRWLKELMMRGVFIEDPATTIIDLSVNVGSNVHIRPFSIIEGKTVIPDGTVVGPYAWIKDGKKQSIPNAG